MDNIVIYLSQLVKQEDVDKMLETFKKECGDDVLENKENKLKKGETIDYYLYKGKGYYTEDQMISSTPQAKILIWGTIFLLLLLGNI